MNSNVSNQTVMLWKANTFDTQFPLLYISAFQAVTKYVGK